MRKIEQTSRYKQDFKREKKGKHRLELEDYLCPVLYALANDQPLDPRYKDHAMTGQFKKFRDCHLRPDLILIYHKTDNATLVLVRLGSHAQLGI